MWIVNNFATFPLLLKCCARLFGVCKFKYDSTFTYRDAFNALIFKTILIDSAANKAGRVSAVNYVDGKWLYFVQYS